MPETNCNCCAVDDPATPEVVNYVPSGYETLLLKLTKGKAQPADQTTWKVRVLIFLGLYLVALAIFFSGIYLFSKYVPNPQPYQYAVFVLASVIFWPLIVVYNSELFYKTCMQLRCLLIPSAKDLGWYAESARKSFGFFSKDEKPAVGAIIYCGFCTLLVFAVFLLKVYCPGLLPGLIGKPFILIICAAGALMTVLLQKRSRNLLVTMVTVCIGLAYYVYITEYADFKLEPLFTTDFVGGTIALIFLVCFVFFLAGTTLMPMLGLFKTFFLSDFHKKLQYPIDEIACSLDSIHAIKKYFLHLTGINLLAFFQLLGVVYFLGLLDTDSIVTKILFVLGSFFPGIMYMAANVFFKKLCRKIYNLQVKHIDARICKGLQEEPLKADELQALVSIKEMYANEFEVHVAMNKEFLVAMLSPVGSALVAVIFPVSSIFGG